MIEIDFVELNKYKILEDNDYTQDERDFYISKIHKRVFSFGRIENESIAWLEQEVKQPIHPVNGNSFVTYIRVKVFDRTLYLHICSVYI